MAGYIESALTRGETVVYKGKVSIASLIPLVVFGLVLLPAAGMGIIFLLWAAVLYLTTEIAITNKRVIAKHGLISRSTIEINLQKIESIQVKQGILGRMLNYGSIVVAGAGNPQAPVPNISNPMEFRKACLHAQEDFAK